MNNPIAFAMDISDLKDVRKFLELLTPDNAPPHIGALKIGLEYFMSFGGVPRADIPIILDLKLHDIPETVARAVKAGGNMGVKYMTLHIQQRKTLEMALEAAEPFGIQLLGVTVLTSMSNQDLNDLGIHTPVWNTVSELSKFAASCGITGFVCSPQELHFMRKWYPEAFLLVPGIRPSAARLDDQVRVGTPKQAMDDGASMIVVGRPIRDAPDPVAAAKLILHELSKM